MPGRMSPPAKDGSTATLRGGWPNEDPEAAAVPPASGSRHHIGAGDVEARGMYGRATRPIKDDDDTMPNQAATVVHEYVSRKFKILQLFGTICIVYIHGFNGKYAPDYGNYAANPQPPTFAVGFEAFLTAGVLRFAVPMFFIMSGYLYFARKPEDFPDFQWKRRTKSRWSSLVVPYFLWNCVAIAISWAFNPPCHYAPKSWTVFLTMFVTPPMVPLWYLRDLFLMGVISPVYLTLHRIHPTAILVFSALCAWPWAHGRSLWEFTGNALLADYSALVWFPLGGYLALQNVDLTQKVHGLVLAVLLAAWIGINVYRARMPFELGAPLQGEDEKLFDHLRKLTIPFGVLSVWFSYDFLEPALSNKQVLAWTTWLSGFSMFLYCSHLPMVAGGSILYGEMFVKLGLGQPWFLMAFLVYPLGCAAIIIGMAHTMSKNCPYLFSLLTGGRGS